MAIDFSRADVRRLLPPVCQSLTMASEQPLVFGARHLHRAIKHIDKSSCTIERKHAMKRNLLALTAFAVGAATLLTSCSSGGGAVSSSSGTSDAITIAVMSGITTELVMKTGIEKGAFSDAGLDAKLVGVENPPAALAAMQGGSADVAYAPLPTALTALSKGIDIKIVAAADGFPATGQGGDHVYDDTTVFVNPKDGITSPKQLEGKKVAVPSRSGLMEIAIAGAVKQDGGDPSKIQWFALDQQSQLTSLVQGRIDAAGLSTPFSDRASAQGMKLLVRPVVNFFEHGAAGVWITTATFAKEHPDVVAKFQKGVSTANAYANAHVDEFAAQIVKDQKLDIPASDVVVGYFPSAVDPADVERANEKMAALGYLPKKLDLAGVVVASK